MKNNLSDLNNHLFSMIEAIEDGDDMTDEQMDRQLKKARTVCTVSEQILKVARLQLSAMNIAEACGYKNDELPALVAMKDSKSEESKKKKLLEELR